MLIAVFVSCQTSHQLVRKSGLTGKWEIIDFDSGVEMEESLRANYEKLKKQMLEGAYIQFDENQRFEMFLMGQKLAGSWQLLDGQSLMTQAENESESELFRFEFEGENSLKLFHEENEDYFILTLIRANQ